MNRSECNHENADWQSKPKLDMNGITFVGQCFDCGALLQERWYEKITLYEDERREWQEY